MGAEQASRLSPRGGLSFDEPSHTYTWCGRPVVNVTRVLSPLIDLSFVAPDVLEAARAEGQAIHRMVELEAKHDLDETSLPPWLKPFLTAWRAFVDFSGFELWASEKPLYNRRYGYAGTPDLIGIPHKWKDPRPSLIDLKRSFAAGGAINLQLAAYADSWNQEHGADKSLVIRRRYGLRLIKDGQYRCQPFESKDDFTDFLTCLAFHRLKEKFNGNG